MTLGINQDDPAQRRRVIFLSYSWNDAAEIASRIKASLEEAGYDIWIDYEHIRPDEEHFAWLLEEALEKCQLFVALLSPYSVRLGDAGTVSRMSVLHNQLILAVKRNLPVVPLMVIECDLPLAINHYDPIDFTAWQSSPAVYQQGIQELLQWIREALADSPRRRYRVYVENLSAARLSFPEELTGEGNFVGREWLMDRLEAWLDGKGRCFLIDAEPGAGKTALVAELVRRNSGGRVVAYHFCSSQNEDTIDARRFVRLIAAMLCGTIPEYRVRLRNSEYLVRALQNLTAEALAAIRNGFFGERRAHIGPGQDLDDARNLTLALVAAEDQAAILELAQTDNVWQRDGVAAGLQAAPQADDDFAGRVVTALQQAR
jgi:hypothetical protein